jgi:hypothetical protein
MSGNYQTAQACFFDVLAALIGQKGVDIGRHKICLTAVFGALAAVGTTFASFFAHKAAAEGG